MSNLNEHINIVTDKLQQLLKKSARLQKENAILSKEIIELKEKEEYYKASILSLNQKVNVLKITSGNVDKADQKEFEKRIDLYIKEIDKCIGILSE